jgi:Flp pilus assembly protein CpaB
VWRRRLSRSPLLFWFLALALALLTGSTVARLVGRAEAAAARYGSVRRVTVATHALAPGDVIDTSDVVARDVPAAFLPKGAMTTPPVGRTVVVSVFEGEPLLRGHVAPAATSGVAALVPDGMRAITVPRGPAPAPVRRGDRVDVLATVEGGEGPPTFAVAEAALVVDVQADSATVAVTPDEAPRVAFAAAGGVVALAIRR